MLRDMKRTAGPGHTYLTIRVKKSTQEKLKKHIENLPGPKTRQNAFVEWIILKEVEKN